MSRQQFTFRPAGRNPEHQRAWEILQAVPEGQRNGFLAQAIREKAEQKNQEETLRRVLREELKGLTVAELRTSPPVTKPTVPTQMTDFLSGLLG